MVVENFNSFAFFRNSLLRIPDPSLGSSLCPVSAVSLAFYRPYLLHDALLPQTYMEHATTVNNKIWNFLKAVYFH